MEEYDVSKKDYNRGFGWVMRFFLQANLVEIFWKVRGGLAGRESKKLTEEDLPLQPEEERSGFLVGELLSRVEERTREGRVEVADLLWILFRRELCSFLDISLKLVLEQGLRLVASVFLFNCLEVLSP
jgi:hypothetical protein